MNYLNTIVPIIMAGAPMLGGYLNYSFGFRSNFLAIAIFVMISSIICLLFFEESLPKEKRKALQMKSTLKDFKQALSSLPFWQLTCVTSLLFAGYIAFLSGSSVLFVVEFGMSKAVFPFIQGAILAGWVIGSLSLNRVIRKWGLLKVKKLGTFLTVLGACLSVLMAFIFPQNPYLLTSGMVLYAFGANWVFGLYFPEGMEILPHIKGITASLLTSVRLMISAVVIGLTSALYNGTIYPLAVLIFVTIITILPTLILYEKKQGARAVKREEATTLEF
jgi:DHA1 family bicyclomycin/chloramphenicol resistance-like MFS transporter